MWFLETSLPPRAYRIFQNYVQAWSAVTSFRDMTIRDITRGNCPVDVLRAKHDQLRQLMPGKMALSEVVPPDDIATCTNMEHFHYYMQHQVPMNRITRRMLRQLLEHVGPHTLEILRQYEHFYPKQKMLRAKYVLYMLQGRTEIGQKRSYFAKQICQYWLEEKGMVLSQHDLDKILMNHPRSRIGPELLDYLICERCEVPDVQKYGYFCNEWISMLLSGEAVNSFLRMSQIAPEFIQRSSDSYWIHTRNTMMHRFVVELEPDRQEACNKLRQMWDYMSEHELKLLFSRTRPLVNSTILSHVLLYADQECRDYVVSSILDTNKLVYSSVSTVAELCRAAVLVNDTELAIRASRHFETLSRAAAMIGLCPLQRDYYTYFVLEALREEDHSVSRETIEHVLTTDALPLIHDMFDVQDIAERQLTDQDYHEIFIQWCVICRYNLAAFAEYMYDTYRLQIRSLKFTHQNVRRFILSNVDLSSPVYAKLVIDGTYICEDPEVTRRTYALARSAGTLYDYDRRQCIITGGKVINFNALTLANMAGMYESLDFVLSTPEFGPLLLELLREHARTETGAKVFQRLEEPAYYTFCLKHKIRMARLPKIAPGFEWPDDLFYAVVDHVMSRNHGGSPLDRAKDAWILTLFDHCCREQKVRRARYIIQKKGWMALTWPHDLHRNETFFLLSENAPHTGVHYVLSARTLQNRQWAPSVAFW